MTAIAADNFNRANANPIGGLWVTSPNEAAIQLTSNAAAPSSAASDCAAIFNQGTWPNDQYAQANLTVSGTTGTSGPGVLVRGSTGAHTYYRVVVNHAATLNV